MKPNRPQNIHVIQLQDDHLRLVFTFKGPRRFDATHEYSIRLDQRGEPTEHLLKKFAPTEAERTSGEIRYATGNFARYGRSLNALAKDNAELLRQVMATVRSRDLIGKARRQWKTKCDREAAAARKRTARQRVERNGPRLLAALTVTFVALGRAGANASTKHPQRKAWELARDAIKRATGKVAAHG